MTYTFAICLIIVAQVGLAAIAIPVFRSVWKGDSFLRRLAQNMLLAFFALLFTLTVVEVACKLLFVQSDGINFTLASRSWFERYWQPINSLGYRDYEWTPEKVGNRKRIVVVGDSFVAGGGVEKIEDRFSNQLGEKLGDDYVVMTVARNGWNTRQEIEGVLAYPYQPDIVIFSYYINDIEGVAGRMGISRPPGLLIYPPDWLRPLVDNSYALNFAYWRLFRWHAFADPNQRTDIQTYQNHLRALYKDPEVWAAHQEELQEVCNLTQTQQLQLVVVVFPDMLKLEETRDLSGRVVDFFQTRGVAIVDVAAVIDAEQPKRLIANSVDTHPSVEVHTLVADALYAVITEEPTSLPTEKQGSGLVRASLQPLSGKGADTPRNASHERVYVP